MKKADKNKGATGSPVYMAPEVLADKAYDEKADVFSFAVVLWELVTNKKPYEEEQFESLDGTAVYSHLIRWRRRFILTPPPLIAPVQKSTTTW